MGADRILVTGATGFLGRAVADHLAAGGRSVRAAVRRLPDGASGGIESGPVGGRSSIPIPETP